MRDSNETNVAYVSRLNNISNNKNHLSPTQQKESFHVKSDGKGEKKYLRKLPHFAKRGVCWSIVGCWLTWDCQQWMQKSIS